MLNDVVQAFDLPPLFWSQLIGCSPRQLQEWRANQREVPYSVAQKLSKAIGVPADAILGRRNVPGGAAALLPPMWLKAREQGLGEAALKAIAMTRLLAAKYDEALSLLQSSSDSYRLLLNEISDRVDLQLPAGAQGEAAASAFLDLTGLAQTRSGIGEVFRGALRARGVLILETPISQAHLEGFCVPVGTLSRTRPCLVANSYATTWFRRNYVLVHEFAHAIFDLEAATAIYDIKVPTTPLSVNIAEERADAFARNVLLPKELLVSLENRGYKLGELTKDSLAHVIAITHAEPRLIATAARLNGMISDEEEKRILGLRVSGAELAKRTFHARGLASLSPDELIYPEVSRWADRLTTFPIAGLRLPIPFVRLVLTALKQEKVSTSRAAELLMITRDELAERYGVQPDRAA